MNVLLFLGAGFSVEADYPTQKQFLKAVHKLKKNNEIQEYEYNCVSLAYYLAKYHEGKEDVIMEEAFSMLDYIYLLNDEDKKYAYLKDAVKGTEFVNSCNGLPIGFAYNTFINILHTVYGYRLDKKFKNEKLYMNFFEKILQKHHVDIITTNYDYVCDVSLLNIGCELVTAIPFYAKFIYNNTGKIIEVCKLHGSSGELHSSFNLKTIIPPNWNVCFKREEPQLLFAWKQAEKLIRNCDILLFIGYSLPKSDNTVRFLLKAGLQPQYKEQKIKKAYVIKPTLRNIDNFYFIQSSQWVSDFAFLDMDFKKFVKSDFLTLIE